MAHELQKTAYADGASIEYKAGDDWILTTHPRWELDVPHRVVPDCAWALNAVKEAYKEHVIGSEYPLEGFLTMLEFRGKLYGALKS